MKTIVLSAGQSTRVKPLDDKNFLKICGKELLALQIENLQKVGLDDFVVVAREENVERLENLLNALECRKKIVLQKSEGMAGAVLSALEGIDEDVLIVSANDLVDFEAYRKVLDEKDDLKFSGFLLAKKVDSYFPGGYLALGHESTIERIIEKPGVGNEPSDLVNIVVHYFRNPVSLRENLEIENKGEACGDAYEKALVRMIGAGLNLKAVSYDGFWQALKFPWHLRDMSAYVFSKLEKFIAVDADISDKAIVDGDVIVESGVKVMAGAVLKGPLYLGKNCVVANNALVRESYIGDDCVIGFATEVARSVLGDRVWTHSNYLGDSIVDSDVSFGAGCVIGNLRFDEGSIFVNCGDQNIDTQTNKFGAVIGRFARFGINSGVMPGKKVGVNSQVGSGVMLGDDLPDNFCIYQEKSCYKLVKNKLDSISPVSRLDMKRKLV
jgi:bifunctional UDP-N-acetylglucosamine pyrophosphorylase/glucosamine-1-phosphate N-acetyltransferase